MPMESSSRSKWKYPRAEGIVIDEDTGRWSDGAFLNDMLREEDQCEPKWHQAEPEEWVKDIEAWERWFSYLNQPGAASNLHRLAVLFAKRKIYDLKSQ